MNINFQLNHLGIYVCDLDKMTAFYTSFFGFIVTDERTDVNPIRFMTLSEKEHHQLLLVAGRKEGVPSQVHQISFLLDDFADLRRVHDKAKADPRVSKVFSLNHGNSWALYFSDPEGNGIECYVHTPWHVAQPHGRPIDFSMSDADIYADTERHARANPTYMPAEAYAETIRVRLAARPRAFA